MVFSASPPSPQVQCGPPYREVELAGRDKWEPLLADMGTLASPRVHVPPPETKIRSYFPNPSIRVNFQSYHFAKKWKEFKLKLCFVKALVSVKRGAAVLSTDAFHLSTCF